MEEIKKKMVLIHWIGRFGNRMFQYAQVNQWAKNNDAVSFVPSEWEGTKLFKNSKYCKIITDYQWRLETNQTHPQMNTPEYRKGAVERYKKRTEDSIEFLDSRCFNNKTNIAFDDLNTMYIPKLFKEFDESFLKTLFEFNENIKELQIYKDIYDMRGTYTVAHLRKGDIADPNYKGAHSCVSKESYLKIMQSHDVNPDSVIWLSDDIKERTAWPSQFTTKNWYSCSKGHKWTYPVGEHQSRNEIVFDFLPELLLMVFAKRIYRANSSFSWWGAFLSDAEVYSPVIKSKPKDKRNDYCLQTCDFVEGNSPHFMGSLEENMHDIVFGTLSLTPKD